MAILRSRVSKANCVSFKVCVPHALRRPWAYRSTIVSYATPASALTTVDIKRFRHEFITIFRFAENQTLHPADISILEPIDASLTRYEEENETVFLARDVMERMRKLTDPRRSMGIGRTMQSARNARQSQLRMQAQRRQR
jgi:hypothetical protein